jgi:serine/threonine protein phosphatase 1
MGSIACFEVVVAAPLRHGAAAGNGLIFAAMGMFARFGKGKEAARTVRSVPAGTLVYAIGDIHGRDDLFADLLGQIDADRSQREYDTAVLILLGDLVDRGPDSREVVERALGLSARFDRFHYLIGNHEECMLAALGGDVRALRYFYRIGGDATIRSYIADDQRLASLDFDDLARVFPASVPAHHADFLRHGEDRVEYGDYVFVHAGVRPGVALDAQRVSDLRWIREEFLNDTRDHGRCVVHGHSISPAPDDRPNRLGIDTGAYSSGILTAAAFAGADRWFLSTAA